MATLNIHQKTMYENPRVIRMQRRTSTRESVLLWPPASPLEVLVDEFITLLLLHLHLILGPLYDTLSNHRK